MSSGPSTEPIPSGFPREPVVLHPGVTRAEVEAARQTPQGRMHGVVVLPKLQEPAPPG